MTFISPINCQDFKNRLFKSRTTVSGTTTFKDSYFLDVSNCAIFCESGNSNEILTIEHCSFMKCNNDYNSGSGGCIYITATVTPKVYKTCFIECSSTSGSCIYYKHSNKITINTDQKYIQYNEITQCKNSVIFFDAQKLEYTGSWPYNGFPMEYINISSCTAQSSSALLQIQTLAALKQFTVYRNTFYFGVYFWHSYEIIRSDFNAAYATTFESNYIENQGNSDNAQLFSLNGKQYYINSCVFVSNELNYFAVLSSGVTLEFLINSKSYIDKNMQISKMTDNVKLITEGFIKVDSPKTTSIDFKVDCANIPDATPIPTPEITPDETPIETPLESPIETPDTTPDESPVETPENTPDESPLESPIETPGESPVETTKATTAKTDLPTPSQTEDDSDSKDGTTPNGSNGALIGGIVAAVIAILIVIAVVVFIVLRKKKNFAEAESKSDSSDLKEDNTVLGYAQEDNTSVPVFTTMDIESDPFDNIYEELTTAFH